MNEIVRFPSRPSPTLVKIAGARAAETEAKGLQFVPVTAGFEFPFGAPRAPGSNLDYASEVKNGMYSSVITSALSWIMRTFPEAPVIVQRRVEKRWEEAEAHELTQLLRRPNPQYGGRVLQMATAMDFCFGEAFWLKIRNGGGKVVEAWWVPRQLMTPMSFPESPGRLDFYRYQPGQSAAIDLPPKDVVHFRFGMDPNNILRGFSPLAAVMREVYIDDAAAGFTAAILKNLGIIGVIFAPESGTIPKDQAEKLKDYVQQGFTGDKRAQAMMFTAPMKATLLQYNLQGFDVGPIRDVVEERVSAALAIPAAVIGFGTGLQQTKVGAPQPLSAQLWTPTGPTTMGAMAPGQTVAIPGGWGRVKNVYPQGEQDIYRITFQDGSTAESTIDHLWDVKLPNQKERCVLPLSEIAAMPAWKLKRASLPLQGVTEFDEQPTLIPPYVMGLLLADGSFRENLFFSNADTDVIERMREEVAVGYDLTKTSEYDYRISYRDHAVGRGKGGGSGNRNPFKDELRRLGLWMLYSPEKFIPDLYKYNSSRVRRELLRGLLDGDGFVNHHGQPAIEQTSARLAADVTWMVQSLGGYTLQSRKRANTSERMIKGHPMRSRHDRYHLSIVIDDAPGLFYCSDKADRCRDRKKSATRKFRSIELVRREQAQCIEVAGGLYLTDNFIVTHNTMREMVKLAWQGGIEPSQRIMADELDRSLLPEFQTNANLFRTYYDTSQVDALTETPTERTDRVLKLVDKNVIKIGQAQSELGYPVDAAVKDKYARELAPPPAPIAAPATPPAPPPGDDPAPPPGDAP